MQPRLLRSPARLASASVLCLQSDARLVELSREGHEQAFTAIVSRYRPALERYAARLAGSSRAEDVVQQALASAHAAMVADDRALELRAWLYRIVHNAAVNVLRSAREAVSLDEVVIGCDPADDAIEQRERLREALDAMSALPVAQRRAIVLRVLEGRSHEEIAEELGLTPGAARQALFRARTALRAAATAVTPQPVIERVLDTGAQGAAAQAGDLAGNAVMAKAAAAVLATGAVVGGAVGAHGVHPHAVRHATRPAQIAAAPARGTTTTAAPSATRAAVPPSSPTATLTPIADHVTTAERPGGRERTRRRDRRRRHTDDDGGRHSAQQTDASPTESNDDGARAARPLTTVQGGATAATTHQATADTAAARVTAAAAVNRARTAAARTRATTKAHNPRSRPRRRPPRSLLSSR